MKKMYIGCPICGRKLSKSAGTPGTELACPKCKAELEFTVKDDAVHIYVVKSAAKVPI